MLPQVCFLEFLAAAAKRYANFRLVMGARVKEFVQEDGVVRGVRWWDPEDGLTHEVRARLTVGTDGRFSRLRKLAGLEAAADSPPMDEIGRGPCRERG